MCLGCMEKHGQHLPVGTDSLHGNKIVELAAERAFGVCFQAWRKACYRRAFPHSRGLNGDILKIPV